MNIGEYPNYKKFYNQVAALKVGESLNVDDGDTIFQIEREPDRLNQVCYKVTACGLTYQEAIDRLDVLVENYREVKNIEGY